jgi:hypothetical protein
MQIQDLAGAAMNRLLGRLLRRALCAALLAAFGVIAFYYASAAGTLALSVQFGVLNAYLIMAGIYAVAAIGVLIGLWATRAKSLPAPKPDSLLAQPRNMQIAMLIEAVMLGYTMARKTSDRLR